MKGKRAAAAKSRRPFALLATIFAISALGAVALYWLREEPAGQAQRPAARQLASRPAPRTTSMSAAPPDQHQPPDPSVELNDRAAQLAAKGEFAEAAALLGEALAQSPGEEVLEKNLQAVLTNSGYAELRAEDFSAAISSFIKAQALGDRVEIERGLGYSYYRQGRLELARVALERAVTLDPGDEESSVTLGQTLLKLRDQAGALAAFEHALELGSTYPGVAETVARLRQDADTEQAYSRIESSHFTIKLAGEENVLAGRTILNGLEEAYRSVGARFGYYPSRRLEAVLYTDQTFDEVIRSPGWSGAIFDGRIKIPARGITRGSERLQRTLRHEYAHSVILELTRGKVPAWLNEGLAQVCEGGDTGGRAVYLGEALTRGGLVALSELERPFIYLGGESAKLAYAEAYFAALYLTESQGRYNVARLLRALGEGEDFARVFEEKMHLSYGAFQERFFFELRRHFGS